MVIINHPLNPDNYHKIENNKDRIIIGNTFSDGLNHYNGWVKRLNGKYTKTANFTILLNGEIYKHFDPKYYSDFINSEIINKKTISIVLENQGWLIKNLTNGEHLTWVGNTYNKEIFKRKWRGHTYWAMYSEKQINSLVELCNDLCVKFNIPNVVQSNNTYTTTINDFKGISYRGNYNKYYSDINPSFDFDMLKNKIELKR